MTIIRIISVQTTAPGTYPQVIVPVSAKSTYATKEIFLCHNILLLINRALYIITPYCHGAYPKLVIKRKQLSDLGEWEIRMKWFEPITVILRNHFVHTI